MAISRSADSTLSDPWMMLRPRSMLKSPRMEPGLELSDGSTGRGGKYNVFGRNGELRRTLDVSRDGKVYEVDDDDESEFEEKSTIRLGLVSKICLFFNPQKTMADHIIYLQGDFIF
uniref:Uncharacterized protein n=1 Tax=Eucampia antarctica TaxID=49252 RepID=A0A7S2S455_9STRA|mmetsp:Transcript_30506/g.29401  ORF Transcript_30506/g.29401 Transcript_30506/m.29401 type:complete len:116 (+) Transcript_30506:112-459(+)